MKGLHFGRALPIACLSFLFLWHACASAEAAPPPAAASAASAPAVQAKSSQSSAVDPSDFQGDVLKFRLPIAGKAIDSQSNKNAAVSVCIPAWTTLTGIAPIAPQSSDGSSAALPTFSVALASAAAASAPSCGSDPTPIDTLKQRTVTIDMDTINQVPHSREGWNTGVLAVPFKYHLHAKVFTTSVSVAPYLGWRRQITGMGTDDDFISRSLCYFKMTCSSLDGQFIGFFGVSLTTLATSSSSQTGNQGSGSSTTSTQSFNGFSYGIGYIGNIKSSLSIGAVLGVDRVSAGDSYPYNHRPWISLEIGKSFSQ